jgi:hypothetical protein
VRPDEPAVTGALLAGLSRWIDLHPANAARDPEALTWGRLAKVAEESGEVIRAYIAATGQNPRRGVSGDLDAVRAELLDVATTALCALEHLDGCRGTSMAALTAHVRGVAIRAHTAPVTLPRRLDLTGPTPAEGSAELPGPPGGWPAREGLPGGWPAELGPDPRAGGAG